MEKKTLSAKVDTMLRTCLQASAGSFDPKVYISGRSFFMGSDSQTIMESKTPYTSHVSATGTHLEKLQPELEALRLELDTAKWTKDSILKLYEGTGVGAVIWWNKEDRRMEHDSKHVVKLGKIQRRNVDKDGKDHFYGYRPILGPCTPYQVIVRLVYMLLASAGVDERLLVPMHNSHKVEEKSKLFDKSGNLVVIVDHSHRVHNMLKKHAQYRAGSDLWKVGYLAREMKVMFVETPKGVGDGDNAFLAHKGEPTLSLGSCISRFNGEIGFIKARARAVRNLNDAYKGIDGIPADIDMIVPLHNLKYVTKGVIRDREIQLVQFVWTKDEDHEAIQRKRKLNMSALVPGMVKWASTEMRETITSTWAWQMKLLAERTYTKSLDEVLQDIVRGKYSEAMSFVAGDFADSTGMYEGQSKAATLLPKQINSIGIPGVHAALICDGFAENGELLVSPEIYLELGGLIHNGKVTVMRNPVNNYQSFITLKVAVSTRLSSGLISMSARDIAYLQGDGDDHALVTFPFSAFEGGEEVITGRGDEMDVTKMGAAEMYARTWVASKALGFLFNAMVTAMVYGDMDLARAYGNALDRAAQEVKKPLKEEGILPEPSLKEGQELSVSRQRLLAILLKNTDSYASAAAVTGAAFDIQAMSKANPGVIFKDFLRRASENQVELAFKIANKLASPLSKGETYRGRVLALNAWVRASSKLSVIHMRDRAVAYSLVALMMASSDDSKCKNLLRSFLHWIVPLAWGVLCAPGKPGVKLLGYNVPEAYRLDCQFSPTDSIVPQPAEAIEIPESPIVLKEWWGSMKATNTADMLLAALGVPSYSECDPQVFEVRVCESLYQKSGAVIPV